MTTIWIGNSFTSSQIWEFEVGIHGHQHSPYATSTEYLLPHQESMVLISAGSLAVGDAALPRNEQRQFNIINIDGGNETITVHVRGMTPAGPFTASHRDDFGGQTSKHCHFLDDNSVRLLAPSNAAGSGIVCLDEAFRPYGKSDFRRGDDGRNGSITRVMQDAKF